MKTDRKIKYDWLQGELCCRLPLARSLPFSPPVPVPVPAPVCPAPSTTRCPVALISCPPFSWRAQTGAVLGQVPALRWAPPASPCPPCPHLGVAVGLPCPVAPFPESSPSLQPACGAIRGVSPLHRQLPLLLLPGLALQSFIWPVVSSSFIKIQLDITGFFF